MSLTSALAIFVKTPELSPVKTRLAKSLGRQRTLEFYDLALSATAALARNLKSRNPQLCVYWAVAEADGCSSARWQEFPVIAQGDGSLGDRLAEVYNRLQQRHAHIGFVGADSPHLIVSDLQEAIDLNNSRPSKSFLLGETFDGGFYFFGGSQKIPESHWRNVEYSQSTTASALVQALLPLGPTLKLKPGFDIDTLEDLEEYRNLLARATENSSPYLPEQKLLFSWANRILAAL